MPENFEDEIPPKNLDALVDYILQARRLRRVQTGALARPATGDAHAQDDTEEAR